MTASCAYSVLLTFCCCVLLATVESNPFQRHQKRNFHSQNGLRRCGNEDFDSTTLLSNEYRYLPYSIAPRISDRNLSWTITRYPEEIDNHTTVESVNFATSEALKLWSSVANLHFYHINFGTPDIEIKFQTPKSHNRQCDLMFSTGFIAHYVSGSVNPGKIHFNEQFEWTTTRFDTRNSSVNLVNAIAHEVGHLLGFGHTILPNSIMSKYYSNHVFTAPVALSSDDFSAATYRYGVKIRSHTTIAVPSTTIQTVSASATATTEVLGCNTRHTKTFFDATVSSHSVCGTLYEFENCHGSYLLTPIRMYAFNMLYETPFGNWENRVSSLIVAPNCRIQVCSVVDGNRTCSDSLTGTITRLDSQFDNRIDTVFCSCDACPIPFPIKEANKNVCAVAYWGQNCFWRANVFSPGQVWLRSSIGYLNWQRVDFGSAQVNPNCTANFCHTETITDQTCLSLNGGANGQNYPKLDRSFTKKVTTVHCSCVT